MPSPTLQFVMKRDPISGLGVSSKEDLDNSRPRTASAGRHGLNTTLISWDTEGSVDKTIQLKKCAAYRTYNPIVLTSDGNMETPRIRSSTRSTREPQRDPISGTGNFGCKEWDPIGKYNGRTRRAKSTIGLRSNPLTGENMNTFLVNIEEKSGSNIFKNQRNVKSSKNIFTGENCDDYALSPEFKSSQKKIIKDRGRNTITGDNCATYDVNSELRSSKRCTNYKPSNPINGENSETFLVSKEEKQISPRPYVYKNTVTGENLRSYTIIPIERNITPRTIKERKNPLNGENIQNYVYRVGEGKTVTKMRDLSSPLTGKGSRGLTYTVSVEEKHSSQPNLSINGHAKPMDHSKSFKNILTGENCTTYNICQEMRSDKMVSKSKLTNGSTVKTNYNIITGKQLGQPRKEIKL